LENHPNVISRHNRTASNLGDPKNTNLKYASSRECLRDDVTHVQKGYPENYGNQKAYNKMHDQYFDWNIVSLINAMPQMTRHD